MKQFKIIDIVSGETIKDIHLNDLIINSNNGKNALIKFRNNYCLSSGIYEIVKNKYNYSMHSSFGSGFYAYEIK